MDGLQSRFAPKLQVVRVNIQDPVGRALAPVYGFEYTPTYIFFDGKGTELWRSVGEIDPQRVQASLAQP